MRLDVGDPEGLLHVNRWWRRVAVNSHGRDGRLGFREKRLCILIGERRWEVFYESIGFATMKLGRYSPCLSTDHSCQYIE